MNSSLSSQERGCKRRLLEPSSYTPYKNTKRSRSTGAYDLNFRQRMIDNSIYFYGYQYPDGRVPPRPENWNEIQQMLIERRPSTSSSINEERYDEFAWADAQIASEDYDEFARADARITSENRAITKVIPMIQ
jgi:hypothetical protein